MSSVLFIVFLMVFSGAEDPLPAPPPFSLSVGGVPLKPHMMAFTARAGARLTLSCSDSLQWSVPSLGLAGSGRDFVIRLPMSHGVHAVTASDGQSVGEWLLVVPLAREQVRTATINSFPLGLYGDGSTRDHLPAAGFIEISQHVYHSRVSTHLRFSDFLCHIQGDWPQYMVLDMNLVHKLEAILEEVQLSYPEARVIHSISGFRTPEYNARIGNETGFSLHLYGAAADIWIESWPPNGLIDDLDRNKRIDVFDGDVIIQAARTLEARGEVVPGGAGAYRWNAFHGPYIHIDTRGSQAVWHPGLNLVTNPVI